MVDCVPLRAQANKIRELLYKNCNYCSPMKKVVDCAPMASNAAKALHVTVEVARTELRLQTRKCMTSPTVYFRPGGCEIARLVVLKSVLPSENVRGGLETTLTHAVGPVARRNVSRSATLDTAGSRDAGHVHHAHDSSTVDAVGRSRSKWHRAAAAYRRIDVESIRQGS